MPLGIRPTVDFAFKKIFGSPQNSAALIGLLNAILDLEHPVDSVEVLNPFSYQEFSQSKLIVLDVLPGLGRALAERGNAGFRICRTDRATRVLCMQHGRGSTDSRRKLRPGCPNDIDLLAQSGAVH